CSTFFLRRKTLRSRDGSRRIRSTRRAAKPRSFLTPVATAAAPSAALKDAAGKTIANLPCFKPPWSSLIAVDAKTGDFAWKVPLGVNEALPEGKRNVGSPGGRRPDGHCRRAGLRRRDGGQPLSSIRFQIGQ